MVSRSGGTQIKNLNKVKPGYDQAFTLPKGTSAAPIMQVKVSKPVNPFGGKIKPRPYKYHEKNVVVGGKVHTGTGNKKIPVTVHPPAKTYGHAKNKGFQYTQGKTLKSKIDILTF
tara:strand:+ start:437 stop:781 length:345 start_codon:yes stop_codon:yes gene_type:complete